MTEETSSERSAQGASNSLEQNPGDFATLRAVLELHPDSDARKISLVASATHGDSWDKHRVNAVIYRMENAGLVKKNLLGTKPYWSLV